MRLPLVAAILAGAVMPMTLPAQMPTTPPGAHDPTRVRAGDYRVEPGHTQLRFGVMHLGFNPYYGVFSDASGTLTLDPAHPDRAKLSVTAPIASVMTTSRQLDDELKSAQWFDAARFPEMRFVSDHVVVKGTTATVTGMLTLHGVTKPLTLDVAFVGAGTMPMAGSKPTIGSTAKGAIRRSDFGLSIGVPMVSDAVTIEITAAFERTG